MTKKILILSANPRGTTKLRLDEEVREIKEGLRLAKGRDLFSIESSEAVRYRDIHRAFLYSEPQIIHFSGHGAGEEGLVFEDETGHEKLVDAEALAGLFKLFADQVECVVLNACYSEVQAESISQHIPYVIGMKKAIGDKAAIEFLVGFYDALGAGREVEFAYSLGCNAIRLAGIAEHLTPVLKKSPKLFTSTKGILTKSSKLTSWQRHHLEQEREGLQQKYDLLHEKLRRLSNTLVTETDEAVRFKLEKQIEREQLECDRIEQAMEIINNKLT